MQSSNQPLEKIWGDLLSRDASLIRTAFAKLDPPSHKLVHQHLVRMATEPDWQPEQKESAQIALKFIDLRKQKKK